MNLNLRLAIEQVSNASHAGGLTFGDIVGKLVDYGVDAYFCDYRSQRSTYYGRDGDTLDVVMTQPDYGIADVFDSRALLEAIRRAQRDEIRYPEFLRRSRAAGCGGYFVWIAGRHISYFGSKGEVHVERFPDPATTQQAQVST